MALSSGVCQNWQFESKALTGRAPEHRKSGALEATSSPFLSRRIFCPRSAAPPTPRRNLHRTQNPMQPVNHLTILLNIRKYNPSTKIYPSIAYTNFLTVSLFVFLKSILKKLFLLDFLSDQNIDLKLSE